MDPLDWNDNDKKINTEKKVTHNHSHIFELTSRDSEL